MFKSIGLGIACLTLTISGVTRATAINVDCGKYGHDKCIKVEKDCTPLPTDVQFLDLGNKDDGKDCTKDICKDDKDDHKDCLKKDLCDTKPVTEGIDDKDGKDGKDKCKIDWCDTHQPVLCDIGDKDKDHGCDLVIDGCTYDPCHGDQGHCVVPCDPDPTAAVPAPASATFGGLGVAGIMLMAGLRSRRSAAL
jgi:hypothetical protein